MHGAQLIRVQQALAEARVPDRPHRGWVRAVRDALGMSAAQLGARVGMSQQRVSAIERAERDRTVTLTTLDRVAQGLGCRVEYILVPTKTLPEMVRARARAKAMTMVAEVDTTMQLEGQGVVEARRAELLEELIEEIGTRRDLWSD